jgi:DNA-binding CsgD family transcriptional regulator
MEDAAELSCMTTTPSDLDAAERDCLELTANGHDPHEISQLLSASASTFIAEETVRSHQQRARIKLHARSLAHAVAIAMNRRLIDLNA